MPERVHIIRGRQRVASELGRALRAPAVAIGNFDGVHLGHQALLATASRLAHEAGGETVVLTFDPHPARFLAPALAPPMLMTLERRMELLAEAGADAVVVEPFTTEFAALPADRFIAEVLRGTLTPATWWWMGFHFWGRPARQRDHARQRRRAPAHGVSIVPRSWSRGCSARRPRSANSCSRPGGRSCHAPRPPFRNRRPRGAWRRARPHPGHSHANLDAEADLVPKPGVYAAWACRLDDGARLRLRAAVSIGSNPTFTAEDRGAVPPVTIEAHLLDFDGDLYGARLRLEFASWLRDQRRFSSTDELLAEIRRDIIRTREILA